jgi:hypothetical protein
LALLVSCDELTGSSTGANDNITDTIVGDGLTQIGRNINGNGELAFSTGLGLVNSSKSFRLRFELEDNGSVEIITYATRGLQNGISFKYTKLGNLLKLEVSGGNVKKEFTDVLQDFNPITELHFVMDVHNGHADAAHLLIWPYTASGIYHSHDATLNSDDFKFPYDEGGLDFSEWYSTGVKGRGQFWGLRLNNAKVLDYEVAPPKDAH